MAKDSRPGKAVRRCGPDWRIPAAGLLLTALALLTNGCGGVLDAVVEYAGADSTIECSVDGGDPENPTYAVSGYVYIDRVDYEISVQADATAPDRDYVSYAGAHVTLASTSSSTSDWCLNSGYFEFTDVPGDGTTYTLTVETPGDRETQFTVDLAASTITPVASS